MAAAVEGRLGSCADFGAIAVGDTAKLTRIIGRDDVELFATLSGDRNPLHMDDDFARETSFQRRVVHGMLVASYVSTLIGMHLPGPGALWTQQSFRWQAPVFIGDQIELRTTILHKSEGTRTVTLGVEAVNQQGVVVLKGEGMAILLEQRKRTSDGPLCERIAFVTGGSRGIGAAIAAGLSAAGVQVAVNYRNDATAAEKVCEAIRVDGGIAIPVQADVADEYAVGEAFQTVRETFGRPVDLLVNNAAPEFIPKTFQELSWNDIQQLIDVQVRGAFNCVQAALPAMTAQKSGQIINVASALAPTGAPFHWSAFHIAKAALRALTRSLATEVGPLGIRVNTVSPGLTETASLSSVPERIRKLQAMQTPLRRLCRPEDIARAVVFLAGDGAEYLSGVDLPVCGGLGA